MRLRILFLLAIVVFLACGAWQEVKSQVPDHCLVLWEEFYHEPYDVWNPDQIMVNICLPGEQWYIKKRLLVSFKEYVVLPHRKTHKRRLKKCEQVEFFKA